MHHSSRPVWRQVRWKLTQDLLLSWCDADVLNVDVIVVVPAGCHACIGKHCHANIVYMPAVCSCYAVVLR